MVDFKKKLNRLASEKPLDPLQVYETLDRASDKGPLRPAQLHVLSQWHNTLRSSRDLIVKLHTGQGKTLIGLLMLQSRLNQGTGPALYLCPNHLLVNQTCLQAKQFGIATVTAEGDIPDEFLSGNGILVTTVHKLFNGLTKFGLGPKSIAVGSVVIDDCHACIDSIKQACSISLKANEPAYKDIVSLFANDLRYQGAGTYNAIALGEFDALLPIPYWAWTDNSDTVAEILAKYRATSDAIKFAWPLLRDMLARCQCLVSGDSLEIVPYLPPLELFGSYSDASFRVFMSATVTDDSFLVKGLGLSADTIKHPLTYPKERWCGEKMILLPSLVDGSLGRDYVLTHFANPSSRRKSGVVALCPSFRVAEGWKSNEAIVADGESIYRAVESLKDGEYTNTLVIVNRYDGVDLPDDACRILILDSRPAGTSLVDRYGESVRPTSELIARRTARVIEQGLGRSVRGEKDYCVIIMTGSELVQALREGLRKGYYSAQTAMQVQIGLEVAEYAKEDIAEGIDAEKAFASLVRKSLDRDEGWKEFYGERMKSVAPEKSSDAVLALFETELRAERFAEAGQHDKAASELQRILDGTTWSPEERAWYLQEIARHTYRFSKVDSNAQQMSAHKSNRYLLRPKEGMAVSRLEVSQKRVAAVIDWVRESKTYEDLLVRVDAITSDLRFGPEVERFERALCELGKALGFASQRPDKEWKEGPDNLWCLEQGRYLLCECKTNVSTGREEINKQETGQMNNAAGWFASNYSGSSATKLMAIPARKLAKGAAFNETVRIVRPKELKSLVHAVEGFFKEFAAAKFDDLDPKQVQQWIDSHKLDLASLETEYCVEIK